MSEIAILDVEDILAQMKKRTHVSRMGYGAMYSSWYGGIVRDPQLMMIPIDDHGFHRGDAVFEAIKCRGRKVFALDRHLERLAASAKKIDLKLPESTGRLRDITLETLRVSKLDDALLRLYVSRGPGGFTTNPYECIAPQFYAVMTPFKPFSEQKYRDGVSCGLSQQAVKPGFFATVKSCNYLPNVLMKKEAVDTGVDFTVSKDENGFLAESSTENFAIIDRDGRFIVPGFSRTLRGVTAVRMMELAERCVQEGLIQSVGHGEITIDDVHASREAMMLGTTLDVLPVTKFANQPIGDGNVGPVVRRFSELFLDDLKSGPLVTAV